MGKKKGDSYIISVDGTWVGKWFKYGYGHVQRAYSPKQWPTKKGAIRSASHRKFRERVCVYRTWGSGPKQRKKVWRRGKRERKGRHF